MVSGFALANESESDKVSFTPELAIQLAQDFADSVFPNKHLTADTQIWFHQHQSNSI